MGGGAGQLAPALLLLHFVGCGCLSTPHASGRLGEMSGAPLTPWGLWEGERGPSSAVRLSLRGGSPRSPDPRKEGRFSHRRGLPRSPVRTRSSRIKRERAEADERDITPSLASPMKKQALANSAPLPSRVLVPPISSSSAAASFPSAFSTSSSSGGAAAAKSSYSGETEHKQQQQQQPQSKPSRQQAWSWMNFASSWTTPPGIKIFPRFPANVSMPSPDVQAMRDRCAAWASERRARLISLNITSLSSLPSLAPLPSLPSLPPLPISFPSFGIRSTSPQKASSSFRASKSIFKGVDRRAAAAAAAVVAGALVGSMRAQGRGGALGALAGTALLATFPAGSSIGVWALSFVSALGQIRLPKVVGDVLLSAGPRMRFMLFKVRVWWFLKRVKVVDALANSSQIASAGFLGVARLEPLELSLAVYACLVAWYTSAKGCDGPIKSFPRSNSDARVGA